MAALGAPPQNFARSSSSGTRSSSSSSRGRGPALLHHPAWKAPLAKAPVTGLAHFPVHVPLTRSGVIASPRSTQQRAVGTPSATRQGRGLGSTRDGDEEDWDEGAEAGPFGVAGKAESRGGVDGAVEPKALSTEQASSLDDLCPSLDSEAWNLLQDRPTVPRPAPQPVSEGLLHSPR